MKAIIKKNFNKLNLKKITNISKNLKTNSTLFKNNKFLFSHESAHDNLHYDSKNNDELDKSNTILRNKKKSTVIGDNKLGLILTIDDIPGKLLEILKVLKEKNVNISQITSKPALILPKSGKDFKRVDIFLDLIREDNDSNIFDCLYKISEIAKKIEFSNLKNIPWFPKSLYDLNLIGNDIKQGGDQLSSDHPGFNDKIYKQRRTLIENVSKGFVFEGNNTCPSVDYTEEEIKTWQLMYDELMPLHLKYACDEYNESMEILQKEKVFYRDRITQIWEMNDFFKHRTGMFFRPTGGLLSEREFLNTLAFKVFPSTQYIRHSSKPLYTPEPDIIHEFLGHAAMFVNEDFANFTQEIGLASLGASDEEIQKLATIYWYTIEFGMCMQNNELKIYGGGILSSPSEILNSVSDTAKHLDFDLKKMSVHPVDITSIQTEYYLAPSFKEMEKDLKEYSNKINRPFNVSFNPKNLTVDVDRKVQVRI